MSYLGKVRIRIRQASWGRLFEKSQKRVFKLCQSSSARRRIHKIWQSKRINYKLPAEAVSRRIALPIAPALEKASIDEASTEVRFSIAVAAFGQLLRGEPYLKGFGYDEAIALAAGARGEDLFGYRAEFLNLVRLAKTARP